MGFVRRFIFWLCLFNLSNNAISATGAGESIQFSARESIGVLEDGVASPINFVWRTLTKHFQAKKEANLDFVKGLLKGLIKDDDASLLQELLLTEASDGSMFLHNAAGWGHLEVVKLLIEDYGVDLELSNSTGVTAASMAAYYNQTEVLEYLVDHGADKSECFNSAQWGIKQETSSKPWEDTMIVIFKTEELPPPEVVESPADRLCSICLEGKSDATLTCGHIGHKACLEQALAANQKCPKCTAKKKTVITLYGLDDTAD